MAAPGRLLNRELSWLDFNRRVLALAHEPGIPLLERLKFVAICSSNLDEFFQVRIAALKDQVAAGIAGAADRRHDPDPTVGGDRPQHRRLRDRAGEGVARRAGARPGRRMVCASWAGTTSATPTAAT